MRLGRSRRLTVADVVQVTGDPALHGDGSDGPATLDGRQDVPWAFRTGRTYTMTRDCRVTTLTFRPGVRLATNGYRIQACDTLVFPPRWRTLLRGMPVIMPFSR